MSVSSLVSLSPGTITRVKIEAVKSKHVDTDLGSKAAPERLPSVLLDLAKTTSDELAEVAALVQRLRAERADSMAATAAMQRLIESGRSERAQLKDELAGVQRQLAQARAELLELRGDGTRLRP